MSHFILSPNISLLAFILLPLCLNPIFAQTPSNVIDRCWKGDPNWSNNRQHLATCSVGFAGKMINNIGSNITFYEVTDPSDDPINPNRGTLRYGVTKLNGPLWITFREKMCIKLKMPLVIGSYTTIDGRGSRAHIANGGCFLLYKVLQIWLLRTYIYMYLCFLMRYWNFMG